MGGLGEKRRLECERVVRYVESQVESFMVIDDGDEPYEWDGVKSYVAGEIDMRMFGFLPARHFLVVPHDEV